LIFARPIEDLSLISLFCAVAHLLSGGEADRLKLYVQMGHSGFDFNTGLVDEHNLAPDTGYPHD